jgi:penicillin-binding protein 1A
MVCISRHTGAVKALVGGYNFTESQINRVKHAKRQIGSTIKPYVYAAALNKGLSLTDVEVDEPFCLSIDGKTWEPQNYDRKFRGQLTCAYALAHSNNIVTIKTLRSIGADTVVALLKKAGLSGPFHTYPSLALGCIDAPLIELVGMFNVFANDGIFVAPYIVLSIKDKWGNRIWKHEEETDRVLSSVITGQIASVLHYSFAHV